MLKSYDYLESSPDRTAIQAPDRIRKERELARAIAQRLPFHPASEHVCPLCGSSAVTEFFVKWDVPYWRCEQCESIFVPLDTETYQAYQEASELTQYWMDENYQNEASVMREAFWLETVDWLHFRSYRYCGKKNGVSIIDIGNRYHGLSEMIRKSGFCARYELADSLLTPGQKHRVAERTADIVLMLDYLQQSHRPETDISAAVKRLAPGGLLFLSCRSGTGLDVLTLKEHASIYPYEHITLPSLPGLRGLLERAGLEVLEWSTPGQMDIGYVKSQAEYLAPTDHFMRNLIKNADDSDLGEFQRFLQRVGLSSYARIIARKAR